MFVSFVLRPIDYPILDIREHDKPTVPTDAASFYGSVTTDVFLSPNFGYIAVRWKLLGGER